MNTRVLAIAALLSATPTALQAQMRCTPAVDQAARSAQAGTLSNLTPAQRVEAARAKARAAGVPEELLNARAKEGRARGMSEAQLAAGMERRSEALARASDALKGRCGGAPGSSAEGRAAPGQNMAALGKERTKFALNMMAGLIESGMPVEQALAAVQAANARHPAPAGRPAAGPQQSRRPGPPAPPQGRRGPPPGRGG
jgi:hypothetical protein